MRIYSSAQTYPQIYLPAGWNAGWNAAKAAIGSSPASVVLIGDSILGGGAASNPNVTGVRSLLRSWLIDTYGLYADFFPNHEAYFTGWSNQGPYSNQRVGFGFLSIPSGNGVNTWTFASPYTCPQMDIIYLDNWPGTWSYNLDGTGNVIVTNQNQNAGGSNSACVKRITLSNLSNTTHSLVFTSQTGTTACAIMGVVCYPNGPVGGGIAYAPLTYPGALLTDKITAYSLNGAVPQDETWLMQGASPLAVNPGLPATAVTAGAATTGGSVDVGTHYYAYTYYGGFGETTVGTSASSAVVVGSGSQTIPLSTIANTVQQPSCPLISGANKNLYRTKASGTGTPGSGSNPWFFLANVANGVTTYTDTTADASLTAQAPPVSFSWTPAAAFGFPCNAQLAVIGMGANDIENNYSATNVSNYEFTLRRLVRAIRRGAGPTAIPPSIVLVVTYQPDTYNGDGGTWASSNNVAWCQYADAVYRIAQAEQCAVVDFDLRWNPYAVTNGFADGSDVHPTDAGNADEFNVLKSIL